MVIHAVAVHTSGFCLLVYLYVDQPLYTYPCQTAENRLTTLKFTVIVIVSLPISHSLVSLLPTPTCSLAPPPPLSLFALPLHAFPSLSFPPYPLIFSHILCLSPSLPPPPPPLFFPSFHCPILPPSSSHSPLPPLMTASLA